MIDEVMEKLVGLVWFVVFGGVLEKGGYAAKSRDAGDYS